MKQKRRGHQVVDGFGERLKELREAYGISQRIMGNRLGISRDAVGDYERNRHAPSSWHAWNIAREFKVSLDWLLGTFEGVDRVTASEAIALYAGLRTFAERKENARANERRDHHDTASGETQDRDVV